MDLKAKSLGFLIVLSSNKATDMISSIMNKARNKEWEGKMLSDNTGHTGQLLLLDGGTVLDGENGQVQATTVHFAARASCPYIMDGHGTKHQTAVNLSFNWDVVVMVRSVDSADITVFSHALTREGRAVRVPAYTVGVPGYALGVPVLSQECSNAERNHGLLSCTASTHVGADGVRDVVREEIDKLFNPQRMVRLMHVAVWLQLGITVLAIRLNWRGQNSLRQ